MKELNHLSVIDAAFLHMESAEMPMHVGSLHTFEPPADYQGNWYDTVKAHVASRMHLAQVFTRKLALMPFDLANPVWIDDDDIDLDYHIRYLVLPKPGTMAQLEALAARLHSSLLDRSRPLWEFYVIEGLADGRIGFYGKVHHAAVDGQAGVTLANSVFDLTPEPRKVKSPRAKRSKGYQLGVAELLSAGASNQFQQLVKTAKMLPGLSRTAVGMVKDALAARREELADEDKKGSIWKMAPVTPFNTTITNQRVFSGVSLPLGEIKAIGKQQGASINDMVLWLVSTALRSFLKESRELPDKTLVVAMPISLREEGDTNLNNQVTGTVLDLATQEADPVQRLKAIMLGTAATKKQMGVLKGVIPTDFPSLGAPWLVGGLAALYGRSRIANRLRFANVVVSNVPGPQIPVYLAGAKMIDYYPVSIVVHGLALNITVQSYMGKLCFGLIACRRAVPDVAELGHHMVAALEALKKLPVPALPEPVAAPQAAKGGKAGQADKADKAEKPVVAAPAKAVKTVRAVKAVKAAKTAKTVKAAEPVAVAVVAPAEAAVEAPAKPAARRTRAAAKPRLRAVS